MILIDRKIDIQTDELFLSIIIPVYNCERFLSDCLDSCLEQDIPECNYEIICINDGSEDNSDKILSDYSKKHKNIKVFSQVNSGVSAARNFGLELSQGKYFMFLDADDFLAENCLNNCRHLLENSAPKTILCLGRYHFTEQGYSDRHLYCSLGEYMGCNPTSGYITNRIIPSDLASNLRFQENIIYGEDELFTYELRMLGIDTIELDEPVYYYRKHENSACEMTTKKRLKRMDSLINSAIYIKEKYDLSQPKVSWFFNHRINMMFDLLVHIGFKDKVHYLGVIRDLSLLNDYTNSTRSPILLWVYIKHSVKVNKKRIKRKIDKIMQKIPDTNK